MCICNETDTGECEWLLTEITIAIQTFYFHCFCHRRIRFLRHHHPVRFHGFHLVRFLLSWLKLSVRLSFGRKVLCFSWGGSQSTCALDSVFRLFYFASTLSLGFSARLYCFAFVSFSMFSLSLSLSFSRPRPFPFSLSAYISQFTICFQRFSFPLCSQFQLNAVKLVKQQLNATRFNACTHNTPGENRSNMPLGLLICPVPNNRIGRTIFAGL